MKRTWFAPPAAPSWPALGLLASLLLAAVLAACGGSSSTSASRSGAAPGNGSCAGVAGAHHARVVVETAPGETTARCVGFSSPTLSAAALLAAAHVEIGTQKYSFGTAVCQVDNVPAHYTQCLPPGKNYWALFVSRGGVAWTGATVGISGLSLRPGDSLGLRYDPPKGNPLPPPPPSRA